MCKYHMIWLLSLLTKLNTPSVVFPRTVRGSFAKISSSSVVFSLLISWTVGTFISSPSMVTNTQSGQWWCFANPVKEVCTVIKTKLCQCATFFSLLVFKMLFCANYMLPDQTHYSQTTEWSSFTYRYAQKPHKYSIQDHWYSIHKQIVMLEIW